MAAGETPHCLHILGVDIWPNNAISRASRSVAQPGSALVWGTRGRRFESCRSDQSFRKAPNIGRLRCSRPGLRHAGFGVDFMVVAPEHELVPSLTTDGQRKEVEAYLAYVNSRSERERQRRTGGHAGGAARQPRPWRGDSGAPTERHTRCSAARSGRAARSTTRLQRGRSLATAES